MDVCTCVDVQTLFHSRQRSIDLVTWEKSILDKRSLQSQTYPQSVDSHELEIWYHYTL